MNSFATLPVQVIAPASDQVYTVIVILYQQTLSWIHKSFLLQYLFTNWNVIDLCDWLHRLKYRALTASSTYWLDDAERGTRCLQNAESDGTWFAVLGAPNMGPCWLSVFIKGRIMQYSYIITTDCIWWLGTWICNEEMQWSRNELQTRNHKF